MEHKVWFQCHIIILSLFFPLSLSCLNGWRQSPNDPNKCYFISVTKKIWFEAESFCSNAAPNAHLTSIASAFETYSISADVIDTPSISKCDQMWIGANDFDQNGQFTWSDGHPFQYNNWGAGQPDLSNQCVSSQARTTGKWKTEPCGIENCFICESYASTTPMTDCYDWRTIGGASTDGVYRISPPGITPFDVWCDMTTDGGGWTVFQKRSDNCTVFWNRLWADYKTGFNGGMDRNYWLGLDRINILSTKDANSTLRIDIFGNRCHNESDSSGSCDPALATVYLFGEWGTFRVENEVNKYKLHISSVRAGNLSSSLRDLLYQQNNNRYFTTVDADNQSMPDINCAQLSEWGAWWHGDDCSAFTPNGKYYPSSGDVIYGFSVPHTPDATTTKYLSPVRSEFKLRRNN